MPTTNLPPHDERLRQEKELRTRREKRKREQKTLTGGFSVNWKADKAMLKQIQSEIENIDKQLAEIAREKRGALTQQANPQPITWLGTEREFGELFRKLHKDGQIAATSPTDALRSAAEHFKGKGGKTFNARNILQSLKNKDDYEASGKAPRS